MAIHGFRGPVASAIEPRIGAKYQLSENHSLSMAYGMHSQTAPLQVYFNQVRDGSGNNIRPNENLDFTKSQHYVVGYDLKLSETMNI